MSAALRLSLGPTSLAVEPRSMMISPSGTGALEGCQVVIWVGSSSSTLRRRRRVVLRWEPRGPSGAAPGGSAAARAGPAPAPGRRRGAIRRSRRRAPGRESAHRGAARWRDGRSSGEDHRGRPGGRRRSASGGARRAAAGWDGRSRCSGRPGGGGIGRPVAAERRASRGAAPSPPSPAAERCVGRIVVGPSGETMREGTGFATGARLRTTLGAARPRATRRQRGPARWPRRPALRSARRPW